MDNVKRSTVAINAVSAGIAGLTSISCASMGDAEAAYFGLFVGFVLLCFAAGIYVTRMNTLKQEMDRYIEACNYPGVVDKDKAMTFKIKAKRGPNGIWCIGIQGCGDLEMYDHEWQAFKTLLIPSTKADFQIDEEV